MRIAVVTSSFLPAQGGGEYAVHDLANRWSEIGHEVRVFNILTSKAWHPEARYSVARFWLPRGAARFGYHRQPWLAGASWTLARVLNKFSPEIVSGHFAYPVAFYLARWRSGVPWIVTAHGSDVVTGTPGSLVDRYRCFNKLGICLRRASAIVAISRTAEETLKNYPVEPDRIHLITNGVDLALFSRPAAGDIRKKLGLPFDSEFLLTVARNSAVKNLALGLRAFAAWDTRPPNLYYVIVGSGAKRLQPEATTLRINNYVLFVENLSRDELAAAYQQASLYVSTSRREFCPLVVLEAMAAGLPQVATNVPGNRDLLIGNSTGLLTNDGEPFAMAAAIEKLISLPALRARLSGNCKERVKAYDLAQVAEQYLALFNLCLHGAHKDYHNLLSCLQPHSNKLRCGV